MEQDNDFDFEGMKKDLDRMQKTVEVCGLYFSIISKIASDHDLLMTLVTVAEHTSAIASFQMREGKTELSDRTIEYSQEIIAYLSDSLDSLIQSGQSIQEVMTQWMMTRIFSMVEGLDDLHATMEMVNIVAENPFNINERIVPISEVIFKNMKEDLELMANIEANC